MDGGATFWALSFDVASVIRADDGMRNKKSGNVTSHLCLLVNSIQFIKGKKKRLELNMTVSPRASRSV